MLTCVNLREQHREACVRLLGTATA
jgi:hypothetical protein